MACRMAVFLGTAAASLTAIFIKVCGCRWRIAAPWRLISTSKLQGLQMCTGRRYLYLLDRYILWIHSAGSRLPAPLAWPLLELWHPCSEGGEQLPAGGGGGCSKGNEAAAGVGAALTWLLGLEAAGSTYLAAIRAGTAFGLTSHGFLT